MKSGGRRGWPARNHPDQAIASAPLRPVRLVPRRIADESHYLWLNAALSLAFAFAITPGSAGGGGLRGLKRLRSVRLSGYLWLSATVAVFWRSRSRMPTRQHRPTLNPQTVC